MVNDKINEYIDLQKDEMISTLKSLIEIPSYQQERHDGMPFGEGPAKALKKALEISKDFGFSVRNYDNYVGTLDFLDSEPLLGILCHLDVVPEGTGWTYPPYECVISNGNIYGRGTIDDKGPAVAVLYAMRALKNLKIPLKHNVRFIMGTNEENGSKDLEYYEKIEKMPPMLFTPDGNYPVINIEKGMLRVSFGAEFNENNDTPHIISISGGKTINAVPYEASAKISGVSNTEIKQHINELNCNVEFTTTENNGSIIIYAKGKSAHASTPEHGENAVTALLKLIIDLPFSETESLKLLKNIVKLFPYGETNGDSLSLSCSDEKSGALTLVFSVFDYSDGQFNGKLDIRFPLCETKQGVVDKLSKTLELNGLTVIETSGSEPHYVDENSQFVQTLLNVYKEQTGLNPYCEAIGGGTYVHNTSGGVAFGAVFPNQDNRMHGVDEFISVDNLLLNAKIFAHAIVEICE